MFLGYKTIIRNIESFAFLFALVFPLFSTMNWNPIHIRVFQTVNNYLKQYFDMFFFLVLDWSGNTPVPYAWRSITHG